MDYLFKKELNKLIMGVSTCNRDLIPVKISRPVIKVWDKNTNPLDYVVTYLSMGKTDIEVEPHWLYIGFGLSIMHTAQAYLLEDGVELFENRELDDKFELIFRLKKHDESVPPAWPVGVLQAVADAYFRSADSYQNINSIACIHPLIEDSSMKHLLVIPDELLLPFKTSFGIIKFLQLVGVTQEEYKLSLTTSAKHVTDLMSNVKGAGGRFHITDIHRPSIFCLDTSAVDSDNLTGSLMKFWQSIMFKKPKYSKSVIKQL